MHTRLVANEVLKKGIPIHAMFQVLPPRYSPFRCNLIICNRYLWVGEILVKTFVLAALAAGVTVASAQAADIAVKAPYKKAVAAQVYDWTGFYAGVNIGGAIARNRNVFNAPTLAPGGINIVSNTAPAGAIGGAQIGYNWQFGNWVLGVEADIQGADMKDTSCTLGCFPQSTYALNQSLDWFGTVRGRAGLATGPVFSYVTGGFAYGGVKTTSTALLGVPPLVGSISETRTGWTVGSGVEASLGGNWTGKIEYLYVDLGTQNVPNPLAALIPLSATSEIHEHIFRVGANYRIGATKAYSEPTANWAGSLRRLERRWWYRAKQDRLRFTASIRSLRACARWLSRRRSGWLQLAGCELGVWP